MKTILGAVALILGAPLAAQSTPAADPHAAHKQRAPGKDKKHQMDCCKMPCCQKMRQGTQGEQMGCCAEGGKTAADQKSKQHQSH